MNDNFDGSVFSVKEPECTKCHSGYLNFKLYENFNGAGADWLQWYCTQNCGFYMNVEIV
jgi:hypothetical protein